MQLAALHFQVCPPIRWLHLALTKHASTMDRFVSAQKDHASDSVYLAVPAVAVILREPIMTAAGNMPAQAERLQQLLHDDCREALDAAWTDPLLRDRCGPLLQRVDEFLRLPALDARSALDQHLVAAVKVFRDRKDTSIFEPAAILEELFLAVNYAFKVYDRMRGMA